MDALKLKRRIIDYLHKYATDEQLKAVAAILNIKGGEEDGEKG